MHKLNICITVAALYRVINTYPLFSIFIWGRKKETSLYLANPPSRSNCLYEHLCKKLDIRYRIFCVYCEFTHQESHLRNEPVSHCAYFEYPQPHHVRLEGFTKQCLRIPLCDTLHRIRCWVRTPILFMVY